MSKFFLLPLILWMLFGADLAAQMVSTVAGSSPGLQDGSTVVAKFFGPNSIAINKETNTLFVIDAYNRVLRKIDLNSGKVSTIAGTTYTEKAKGVGFTNPVCMTPGKNGEIYITDFMESKVKKVTQDGVISNYAGSVYGCQEGNFQTAKFGYLTGITSNSKGDIFVSDFTNCLIWKIAKSGQVSIFAGSERGFADGPNRKAKFRSPYSLTTDKFDNVYVGDIHNYKLRKITPNGDVTTVAGTVWGDSEGPVDKVRFARVAGIVVNDDGTIYVSDFDNNNIKKITAGGFVTTVAGKHEPGCVDVLALEAMFNGPVDLAIDKENNIYIADFYNSRIRKIDFSKHPIWSTWWFIMFEIFTALLLISVAVALRYRTKLKRERETNRVSNMMYELEMKAMKAQMSPHFIFNSLNSIQQFILENDNDNAYAYLSKFSMLVRKILESNTKENIVLEDEIKILEGYLEMESLRFEDAFMYGIKISEKLVSSQVVIPHMMIQPFVENAIWHGLLHKKSDRKVNIEFSMVDNKRILCIIDDNGVGRGAQKENALKVGKRSLAIDLINQRLELLCKEKSLKCGINIIDKKDNTGNAIGTKVEVIMPILN